MIQPDAYLTQACARPVKLPNIELTQAQVEKYWIRDRKALIKCGWTKKELIKFYKNRDRQ